MASYNEPNGGKKSFSNNPYNNLSNNSQNVPNVTPSGGSSSYNNHKNINYGKIALLVLVVIAIVCVFKMCSIDQGSSNNGIAYTPSIAHQTDAPTVDTKPIDTQLTDIQPNKTQSTAPSSHKGLKRIITSPLDPEILDLTFEDSETQEFNITVDDPGGRFACGVIEKLAEPIFFFLELPDSERDGYKTYYLDNCTKEVALAIMKRYGTVLVNDGVSRFGFGSHKNDEEIYFTDYQEFQIYSRNPKKLEKLFDRLGIDVVGEDEVVTLWDLINEDNAGCISCVEADGETVFDIPENLKSEGMYEAE